MKIAFLTMYSGCVNRGVETYVHALSNELVKLGHEVVVYQEGDKLPGAKYKTEQVRVDIDWEAGNTHIPFVNYWSLKIREFTKKVLPQLDKDFDIIVTNNGQWMSLLTKIWAIRHNKILVIPGQSGRGLDDRINLYTFPNTYIGLTKTVASWAGKVNPVVRTVHIPNGVELDKFTKKGNSIKTGLKGKTVLTVAALTEQKRVDLVIKAVANLNNVNLFVVGDGAKKDYIKKLGKDLLGERFALNSFTHYKMPEVYRSADMFALTPKPSEAFGIVFVEAMATGLPVVTIDDEQRREIVGDAGNYVDDPEDVVELSEAIQKTLDTNWGDKPRKQAEKFSWDEIAKEYEKLFVDLHK